MYVRKVTLLWWDLFFITFIKNPLFCWVAENFSGHFRVSSPSRVMFKFWRFITGHDEEVQGVRRQNVDIIVPGYWSLQVSAEMSWPMSARIQGLSHSWLTFFWKPMIILNWKKLGAGLGHVCLEAAFPLQALITCRGSQKRKNGSFSIWIL